MDRCSMIVGEALESRQSEQLPKSLRQLFRCRDWDGCVARLATIEGRNEARLRQNGDGTLIFHEPELYPRGPVLINIIGAPPRLTSFPEGTVSAPVRVLVALLEAYPEGLAQSRALPDRPSPAAADNRGREKFPIHIAIKAGASVQAIKVMLDVNPAIARQHGGDENPRLQGMPLFFAIQNARYYDLWSHYTEDNGVAQNIYDLLLERMDPPLTVEEIIGENGIFHASGYGISFACGLGQYNSGVNETAFRSIMRFDADIASEGSWSNGAQTCDVAHVLLPVHILSQYGMKISYDSYLEKQREQQKVCRMLKLLLEAHPAGASTPAVFNHRAGMMQQYENGVLMDTYDGAHGQVPLHLAVLNSNHSVKFLEQLIDAYPMGVASVNSSGETPVSLFLACCHDRIASISPVGNQHEEAAALTHGSVVHIVLLVSRLKMLQYQQGQETEKQHEGGGFYWAASNAAIKQTVRARHQETGDMLLHSFMRQAENPALWRGVLSREQQEVSGAAEVEQSRGIVSWFCNAIYLLVGIYPPAMTQLCQTGVLPFSYFPDIFISNAPARFWSHLIDQNDVEKYDTLSMLVLQDQHRRSSPLPLTLTALAIARHVQRNNNTEVAVLSGNPITAEPVISVPTSLAEELARQIGFAAAGSARGNAQDETASSIGYLLNQTFRALWGGSQPMPAQQCNPDSGQLDIESSTHWFHKLMFCQKLFTDQDLMLILKVLLTEQGSALRVQDDRQEELQQNEQAPESFIDEVTGNTFLHYFVVAPTPPRILVESGQLRAENDSRFGPPWLSFRDLLELFVHHPLSAELHPNLQPAHAASIANRRGEFPLHSLIKIRRHIDSALVIFVSEERSLDREDGHVVCQENVAGPGGTNVPPSDCLVWGILFLLELYPGGAVDWDPSTRMYPFMLAAASSFISYDAEDDPDLAMFNEPCLTSTYKLLVEGGFQIINTLASATAAE